jgi:hypothetical protein
MRTIEIPIAPIAAKCDRCLSEWNADQKAIPSDGATCPHCPRGRIQRTGVQLAPIVNSG